MPTPDFLSGPLSRRSFIATAGAIAAATAWSSAVFGKSTANVSFSDYPFQLGVASGDPNASGMVLWTRLAPKPLEGGGMSYYPVEVQWMIAEDEGMSKVVKRGTAMARPEWAHSVHVEVEGLKADRWYWYQFKAGNEVSPKGRTRTMPSNGSKPQKLDFAFVSCQHYEAGLFTGYEHMARENLDLVIHLGDYIYEGAGTTTQVRRHHGFELYNLNDYRARYAQYRMDPALAKMHAAAPWIVTWDDHEFDNNCAGDISEEAHVKREDYLIRRAAAYQAYYEHMPLRRSCLPQGPHLRLYRRVQFGQLVNFFVLDTRQYRTDQPCGDGQKDQCEQALSSAGSAMGIPQRNWLFKNLSASRTQWNTVAQQIMIARADRKAGPEAGYSMDQWPGYEWERRALLKHLHNERIRNPITIAGDIHTHWANDLIADFDGLNGKVVASEFVGTSISSSGDGNPKPTYMDSLYSENPFVKYHSQQRGYVTCHVTPKHWRSDYKIMDYVTRPGSPIKTSASFVVEDGRAGLQKA